MPDSRASATSLLNKQHASSIWWVRALFAGAILLCVWVALLAWKWPFTQSSVLTSIKHQFQGEVHLGSFHSQLFPPGYVADNVTLIRPSKNSGDTPVTVRRLTVVARWLDLLFMRRRIEQATIDGLRVRIPARPPGMHREPDLAGQAQRPRFVGIGELLLQDAVFAFAASKDDNDPFTIAIQRLSLRDVNATSSSPFDVRLAVSSPQSVIHSTGRIGPWNWNDPGRTELSGSLGIEHADLSVLGGIAGTFTGNGMFKGPLSQVVCNGSIDVPQFHLTGKNHSADLQNTFQITINGLNGDTTLDQVQSRLNHTIVQSQGVVHSDNERPGKITSLQMSVDNGRVEDFLSLFTQSPQPSMTGAIGLRADVVVPPGPPGFLTKLQIVGDFHIDNGRFTSLGTQSKINRLSKSAEGMRKDDAKAGPSTVFSNLTGHLAARNGTANLSNSAFTAPGAHADISGRYSLLDKSVHLHGLLKTTGKLSDTTSGFKTALLKVVTPFWKKKSVTVVPFTISGTAHAPVFTLDIVKK